MRLRCKYKLRFVLQTIASILISIMLPRRKLEQLVIKLLEKHFNCSPYEFILTSSGRSALALLFKSIKNDPEKNCHKVLVPDYICNVVYEAAKYGGLEIRVYKTDENYKPVMADIRKKMEAGDCCVLLASILGRINNGLEIVNEIRDVDPNCIIIYDECQNLMGARRINLDRNSHILLSFNNKMTPGLLGGVVVSIDSNNLLKVCRQSFMTDWKYNMIMLITYLKQNLRTLYYAFKAKYPVPSEMEFSLCQDKYSVFPIPMSCVSLSAAYTALKNLAFHHDVLTKNNEVVRELQQNGFLSIQGIPDTDDAPFIPVVNYCAEGIFPMKGRYGTPGEQPREGTENCIILSNSFLYSLNM